MLDDVLGTVDSWERMELTPGAPVPQPAPLFAKVDLEELLDNQASGE